MTQENNTINYKDYIKQNNIKTTSEFEEYLKDIHSKHYMGTDDDMSDNFDTWLSKLETSELIYYADDFKNLAEQSLVERAKSEIKDTYRRTINGCYWVELGSVENILNKLLSINNKEK